jgi:prophage DNA circulation protein
MSSISNFTDTAQAVVASIIAACPSPLDAINALAEMAAFSPSTIAQDSSAMSGYMVLGQSATADLLRRFAVIGACQASADYTPTSYEDGAALRARLCALLDAEILSAADAGLDDTFMALRALKSAVVQDLTSRSADLSRFTTVSTPAPQPSLVIAQRIYRDPSRADELVQQADPIHPAFMPVSFKALSE